MENKKLEVGLENIVKQADLNDLTAELLEVGIDELLEEGILQNLPIINIIRGVTKLGFAIKDGIFLKKILFFLHRLRDIPIKERNAFLTKIDEDNKYKSKVGETLILIIDKIDDFEKPEIIGNLFRATIVNELDYESFLYLSFIVNNSYTGHIKKLADEYQNSYSELNNLLNSEKVALAKSGFLDEIFVLNMSKKIKTEKALGAAKLNWDKILASDVDQKVKFKLNTAGKQILEFGMLAKKKKRNT